MMHTLNRGSIIGFLSFYFLRHKGCKFEPLFFTLVTSITLIAGAAKAEESAIEKLSRVTIENEINQQKKEDENAQEIFERAYSARMEKDWLKALKLYQTYVNLKPDNAVGLRNLAFTLHQLQRSKEAIAVYRRAATLAPNDPKSWTANCWIEIQLNRPKKARPACVRAYELAPGDLVNTVNLGNTWLLVGQRKAAWHWYEKSISLLDNLEDLGEDDETDFYHFITKGWQRQLAREARAWFVHEGKAWLDRKAPADQLLKDSEEAKKEGNYLQEISLLELRLALLRNLYGTPHPRIIESSKSLYDKCILHGRQLNDASRFAEAIPAFRCATTIFETERGVRHPELSFPLNTLAGVYAANGQYAQALPLYKRTLAIRENAFGLKHRVVAETLNDLALTYQSLGQYAQALPLYHRALAIYASNKGSDLWTAKSLNNLASLYQGIGQASEAIPLVQRALSIYENATDIGPAHPNTATTISNLASLHFSLGQYEVAEPLLIRALAISEKTSGTQHPNTGIALNNLAMLYGAMQQPQSAQSLIDRAYRIALNSGIPEFTWTVQGNLSDFHAKPQPDLAIFYGKQAINTLQAVRGSLKTLDKNTQKSFLGTVEKTYQKLADLLISQGRLPEAQQVLAMLKEDEYYEFISRDASSDARFTRASFTGQEAPWDAKLQASGGRLTAIGTEAQALRQKKEQGVDLPEAETRRLRDLETELQTAGAAFTQVLDELQQAFTDITDKTRFAELEKKGIDNDLTDVVASFGSDVALLQYIVMPEGTHILLTTGATRLARKANVPQAELNQAVNGLLASLRSPGQDPRPAAQKLYGHLIGPVADDLQAMHAKTLMLSLDGVLRYVPMAALHDGEHYLAQRYALALYTDAARERLKDKPQPSWKVAGLGVTQAKEGFAALPAVREELNGLVRTADSNGVLPGIVKLDEKFTSGSFKEALRERYPVLHIASHFQFDPSGDTASFLLLGDGARLSLNEIRKNGYSFAGVDLMTLSACQTGVGGGKDANGREIEGLGVLAQKQGAKGVIATLWPVADASTAELMQSFYRLREEKKLTKAEALRQAQLALLTGKIGAGEMAERGAVRRFDGQQAATFVPDPGAPFAHPYYWAPFILMGNWL